MLLRGGLVQVQKPQGFWLVQRARRINVRQRVSGGKGVALTEWLRLFEARVRVVLVD